MNDNTTEAPTRLADQVERLWMLKQLRSEVAAQDKKLKAQYDDIAKELTQQLLSVGATGAACEIATAELTMQANPKVIDRQAFRLHIIKSGEIDLLEDRLAKGAIRDRWRTGEQIPGVEAVEEFSLSLRKK